MTRKFFGLVAAAALVSVLVGCGSSSTSSEDDECTKHPDSEMCQDLDDGDDVIEVDEATDPLAL